MVNQGTVLTISATNETYEFLETNESTGGRYTKVTFNMKPGGFKPAMHIHMMQDEKFDVISGFYTYETNGAKKKSDRENPLRCQKQCHLLGHGG